MKTKSFFAGLCTMVLAVAMLFGALAFTPAVTAKAAGADEFDLAIASADALPSVVSYGDTLTVNGATNYDVTVTAPNGKEYTVSGATNVPVDQLGHYTVKYALSADPSLYYTYDIYSKLDEDVRIFVKNEANIPTIVATGAEVNLPATTGENPDAYVGYYDEDGEIVVIDQDVELQIDSTKVADTTAAYKFENAGTAFVTYYARIGSTEGTKFVSKTYEVKVQNNFKDEKKPSLSVSGVPSTGNVNKAVKLPVATASDNYDENVKVVITVQYKNEEGNLVNVKEAVIDKETDTATGATDKDAIFDNDENMTFYPTTAGDYNVVYQAIDDNGNESAKWTYKITVSDKKAPVITLDETAIPAQWGYSEVYKLDNNAKDTEVKLADNKIEFAIPEVSDNLDSAENVKISFVLKDAEGKVIVNFTNINQASGESGTYYTNQFIGRQDFNKTANFVFDIAKYSEEVRNENNTGAREDYTIAGDYVVTYSAQDKAGNKSTKTYTIDVTETFKDSGEVKVEFEDLEERYIVANEAVEFTVPVPSYSSATDSKLTLTYTIGNGTDAIEVKGGEDAVLENRAGTVYLVIDEEEVALAGKIVLTANAVSNAGNTLENAVVEEIAVVTPATEAAYGAITANLDLADRNQGETINLGGFVVAIKDANADGKFEERKNVGVEIGVKDADGNYLGDVSAEIYDDDNLGVKVVRNVTVNTNAFGTFYLEYRVFDVNGNSTVAVKAFEIKKVESDIKPASTSVTSAAINEEFVLDGTYDVNNGKIAELVGATDYEIVFVHKVNGGRFALIGDKATALSTGSYKFQNAIDVVKTTITSAIDDRYVVGNADLDNYLDTQKRDESFVKISDNSTVKFELQGILPTYVANGEELVLLDAVAYTDTKNADSIDVEVKKNGKKVELSTNADGKEYFKAEGNGSYTIIYTVKNNGDASTFEYSVKTGDVQIPTITLSGKHSSSASKGSTFHFLKIEATDDVTDAAKLTYTKKVLKDGATYGGTISGTGMTSANKVDPSSGAITFDEAGTYTVRYEVKDAAGNVAYEEFEITVTGESSDDGMSMKTLAGILIAVGIVLILGVVVYLFRSRKVVKKNDKK